MDPADLSAATKASIEAQLVAAGIDPSYYVFVARHATEPDATWRWCCGSSCDPCVERLGQVVDAARQALVNEAPTSCQPGANEVNDKSGMPDRGQGK